MRAMRTKNFLFDTAYGSNTPSKRNLNSIATLVITVQTLVNGRQVLRRTSPVMATLLGTQAPVRRETNAQVYTFPTETR